MFRFNNSFAALGEAFFSRVLPSPLENARLLHFNPQVAELLSLDPGQIDIEQLVRLINGDTQHPEAAPLAAVYAGHQFGNFVPQLGDGRAILLGEVLNIRQQRWDLQVKGAGLTPYSRQGDGRAVLRSSIREYLCSEAMHALGIPSTRALCLIGSDTEVYRESIESGALLVRVAQSHLRFGSFEYFFHRKQYAQVKQLADYVIAEHYPALLSEPQPYLALLESVIDRTASMIAKWQAVGFSHGVMNTDNMSVLGLTMDYGPFGFMDGYQPGYICNHSDHQGRYAFDQQPSIGLWNLTCFAQALIGLITVDEAKAALKRYQEIFVRYYTEQMLAKLGLPDAPQSAATLGWQFLSLMEENAADYTITFRLLCDFDENAPLGNEAVRNQFLNRDGFDQWAIAYAQALTAQGIPLQQRSSAQRAINPKYILRNYLAQIAIEKATDEDDYSEIDRLLTILQNPFDEHPEHHAYAALPPDWAKKISVSCSS